MSRTAAASTMLRMTNFLIALSFGTHRAQFVQRTAFTCPRLCLQRPPLRRFLVCGEKERLEFSLGTFYNLLQQLQKTDIETISATVVTKLLAYSQFLN